MALPKYLHNVLVGLDQFCNTLLGGHPDETMSARSGRAADAGKPLGIAMKKILNTIQHDHVLGAEINDAKRAETVEFLEKQDLASKVSK